MFVVCALVSSTTEDLVLDLNLHIYGDLGHNLNF